MAKVLKVRMTTPEGRKRKTFTSYAEAAKAAGIPYMTMYMRMKKLGMSPVDALKKPVRQYRKSVNPMQFDECPIGA